MLIIHVEASDDGAHVYRVQIRAPGIQSDTEGSKSEDGITEPLEVSSELSAFCLSVAAKIVTAKKESLDQALLHLAGVAPDRLAEVHAFLTGLKTTQAAPRIGTYAEFS